MNMVRNKSGLWVPAEPRFQCYTRVNQGTGAGTTAGTGGAQQAAAGGGGGVTLPSGYTALLDAETLSAGAFGTPANPGSAGSTWKQNHTNITVESAAGPGSRKWVKNPKLDYRDWVTVSGKTLADYFKADDGMIGFIFKCENGKTWLYADDGTLYCVATAGLHGPAIDSSFAFKNYTPATWRAGVFRWNGTNSYHKLDGDASWATGADGSISAMTAVLRVIGDGVSAGANGVSLFAAYDAQSEAAGDELLAHLAGLLS